MEHTTATDQAGTGSGARRRRPILASLTTLGLAAGLVGVTGFFAAGSDSATTGTNEAVSGEVDFPDVDLLLSHATYDRETQTFTCVGEFTDDLTTGLLTADGRSVHPAFDAVWYEGAVCVQNAGDTAGTLSVTALDVVDDETGCSEEEAAVDDTCGTGIGELSNDLRVGFTEAVPGTPAAGERNCFANAGPDNDPEEGLPSIAAMADTSSDLGRIEAGETIGLCPTGYWNTDGDSTPFIDSQTDRTTWRFRFDSTLAGSDPDPQLCVDDANEDNDTSDAAVEISEDGVEATACPDDDDQWFLPASASSADTRTITLDWASDLTDLDLVVYDATTDQFLGGSDQGLTIHEEVTVPAGRDLHIVVVPYSGPRADYELGITVNPAP